MTLLYLLAKNEEWMVGCGLLTDGELTVFTSREPLQMDALLDKMVMMQKAALGLINK